MSRRWCGLFLCCVLLTSGCAGPASYVQVVGVDSGSNADFEVRWPQTWVKYVPSEDDEAAQRDGLVFHATRDGFGLQSITAKKRDLKGALRSTTKAVTPGMASREVGGLFVDDFQANAAYGDFQLVEHSPSQLGGAPGFKIVGRYRAHNGLPRKVSLYGCVYREHVYLLSYDAANRHYFPLDEHTFEEVKASFQWRADTPPVSAEAR